MVGVFFYPLGGCSLMAERLLPKQMTRVRFSSPAPAEVAQWQSNTFVTCRSWVQIPPSALIMYHLAIMRKSWGLLPKILTGEKTIESRWYKNKYSPWDKIKKGDIIYFKNSGEPVTIKTKVSKIIQYPDLTSPKAKQILQKYGARDGLDIDEIDKYYQMFKDKNYCLLVFLRNPQKIKPFNIDKSGFGAMSAWITVNDINQIKEK